VSGKAVSAECRIGTISIASTPVAPLAIQTAPIVPMQA
jgi:hypothetical protein